MSTTRFADCTSESVLSRGRLEECRGRRRKGSSVSYLEKEACLGWALCVQEEDRIYFGALELEHKSRMAAASRARRWSLAGKTALVTGGTKGIGYVPTFLYEIMCATRC